MQTTAQRPANARATGPGGLRWLLARAWCLLLGAQLGHALRSALGGSPAPIAGPPVRPRRERRAGRAHGAFARPYPSAA